MRWQPADWPAPVRLGSLAPDLAKQLTERYRTAFRQADDGVWLTAPAAALSGVFAEVNAALRAAGQIPGWRDELLPLRAADATEPIPEGFATLERAAARVFGTLTLGAHANGWVADERGRPAALWVAERSASKPTDPGLLDNLVGGGVPAGQSPAQTLVREAWEEAGLSPGDWLALSPGAVLRIDRDVAEGRQVEHLHIVDLQLPPQVQPRNQDGEVAALRCLPVDAALALAREGAMTVDATLATLDFALRHRLLPGAEAQRLGHELDALRVVPATPNACA